MVTMQDAGPEAPPNTAAWLGAAHARLEVGPAPYTRPAPDELVVANRAVAVNPLDWILQVVGNVIYRWLEPPCILGADIAGEVVEVGERVTRFRPGDRVLAHAVGTDKDSNSCARSAFQAYTVVFERMAAPIPHDMPYENAVVLPLALSTAACALFQQGQLALQHPSASPSPTGRSLLVWGGSTSVGSNAIQLAVAAGYDVITTASPRNFDYVRGLGAREAFDHASETAVRDITAALQGTTVAGAIAIGTGSGRPCVDILAGCTGNRVVSMTSTPISFARLAGSRRGSLQLPCTFARIASSTIALQLRARRTGVRARFVNGGSLKHDEVGTAIYERFLPSALAEGRYRAVPEPQIVGTGLASLQTGLDVQLAGVSARKVVVSL
jgi:NADPH:quinone reductase-like Zn-dependent oxidoreductase